MTTIGTSSPQATLAQAQAKLAADQAAKAAAARNREVRDASVGAPPGASSGEVREVFVLFTRSCSKGGWQILRISKLLPISENPASGALASRQRDGRSRG
jgi:hypothetical protein